MRLRVTLGTQAVKDVFVTGRQEWEVTIPDDQLVTFIGLELLDENGVPSTILRTPFTIHAIPHFNESGGCLCTCVYCVADLNPESAYMKCICPDCNEECPTDRLEKNR